MVISPFVSAPLPASGSAILKQDRRVSMDDASQTSQSSFQERPSYSLEALERQFASSGSQKAESTNGSERSVSPFNATRLAWEYHASWNGMNGGHEHAIRSGSWKNRIRGGRPKTTTTNNSNATTTTPGTAGKINARPAPSAARTAAQAALGGSVAVRQTRKAAEWVLSGSGLSSTPSRSGYETPLLPVDENGSEREHGRHASTTAAAALNARPGSAAAVAAAAAAAAAVVADEQLDTTPREPCPPSPPASALPAPGAGWQDAVMDHPVLESFKSMSVGYTSLPGLAPAVETSTPSSPTTFNNSPSPPLPNISPPNETFVAPFAAHASEGFETARTRLNFVPGAGGGGNAAGGGVRNRRGGSRPTSPQPAPFTTQQTTSSSRPTSPQPHDSSTTLSPRGTAYEATTPTASSSKSGVGAGLLSALRDFLEHPVASFFLPSAPRVLLCALVCAAQRKGRSLGWGDVTTAYRESVPRSLVGVGGAASATSLALALTLALLFLAAAAGSALLLTTSFLAFAFAAALSAALALLALVLASMSWSMGLVGGAVGVTTGVVAVGQSVLGSGSSGGSGGSLTNS